MCAGKGNKQLADRFNADRVTLISILGILYEDAPRPTLSPRVHTHSNRRLDARA